MFGGIAISKNLEPAGAEIVEGDGCTLLPGLIDAHTHAYGKALSEALAFGVTTELDMFTDPGFARKAKDDAPGRHASLFSAGTLATVPGGHGTEYGLTVPTLTRPEEAEAWVKARVAEGSDYIKVVLDDGHAYGLTFKTLEPAVVKALAEAGHAQGKLVLAHVGSLADAKTALRSGVDGLVHTFADAAPDAEFIALARSRKAFVVPTLSVNATVARLDPGASLAADAALKPFLDASLRAQLLASFPGAKGPGLDYAHAEASVKRLKEAGVPVLAGTDAPNPGTAHGVSLHGELERLVKAGLSPLEALQSATSLPARTFRVSDRGRIAEGLRADLLLVKGDPTKDILATRAIEGIWIAGLRVPRTPVPAPKAPAGPAAKVLLGAFDGDLKAATGMGWEPTTDAIAGGKSTVRLDRAAEGAEGSPGSLRLSGRIEPGFAFPWAGTIWFPGAQPFAPGDCSSHRALTLWAKGDGTSAQVLVYHKAGGFIPLARPFTTTPEWKAHRFEFTAFPGLDPAQITAVAISATPKAGPFAFQIDQVAFE